MKKHIILGIDIGGTGIKGGLVNVKTGEMETERFRYATPSPATPAAVSDTVKLLVDRLEYKGPVGVGFPAIVRRGVAGSAANFAKSWIGTDITKVLKDKTGLKYYALNDADAAGIASLEFGTGKPFRKDGVVLMITVGTGLGGALFVDGKLMPNLEIGQIFLQGQEVIAEKYISNRIRKDTDMGWPEFGQKFNTYLSHVDAVLNPDLIVLGGRAAKFFDKYKEFLKTNAKVKAAKLQNAAGTIGAAYYAYRRNK